MSPSVHRTRSDSYGISSSIGHHRSRFLGSARRHFYYVSLAMSPSVHRTRPDSHGISSSIGPSDTIGRDFWGPRVDTSTTFHSLCLHRSIGHDLIHLESVRPSVHRTPSVVQSLCLHRLIGHDLTHMESVRPLVRLRNIPKFSPSDMT